MSAHYTIIQFVPDPIKDERINIGIVVLGEEKVYNRFLRHWHRVVCFAGDSNIAFLHQFAQEIEKATSAQQTISFNSQRFRLTRETLEAMSTEWCGTIQFTPLRWSSQPAEEVLETNARRLLVDREPRRRQRKIDRGDVIRTASQIMEQTLVAELGTSLAASYVQRKESVCGRRVCHEFDMRVYTDRVLFAAQALSFARSDNDELQKDIRSIGFDLLDVRENFPDMPLGVVVHAPDIRTETYARAVDMFFDCDANVLETGEVGDWVKTNSRLLKTS